MNGGVATDAVIVAAMVVTFVALGIVCWIFWRAAQRDKRGE